MKKLLTILLTLLILFTMVGCNNSSNSTMEEQPISTEEYPIADIQQDEQDIAIVGGYTDVEDKTITDELRNMFNSVFEGFTGASYEPVELIATQVVAGTNYKFLANGTKTTNPIIKGTYYIYINKDLKGNISLLDIETIEESQEETKQEISKEQDPTKLSYWVVFYNPDGHELYRTTMKYGSTPVYEGDTPSYWDSDYWYKFVCWTDKQGNEIKEFKPITGNTYIYAKYKMGGELKQKKDAVTVSVPTPTPSHVCAKTSTYLIHIINVSLPFDFWANVYEWNSGNNEYEEIKTNYHIDGMGFSPIPMSSDVWIHTNNYDVPNMGNQQYCDDYEAHAITCFVAGTQVQYDLFGHTKNIEDFKVGDQIVSYNMNTNKYYLAKVGNIFVHEGNEKVCTLANVVLEDGSVITMTPNHPILTATGFRAIDNSNNPKLHAGQFVMTTNGWTMISKIKVYSCEPTVTYNLGIIDYDEIVDDDTYDTYVADGIVVHNVY